MSVTLGHNSFLGGGAEVEADVTVGNYTSIASHAHLIARVQHACIADPNLAACGSARIPGYPASHRKETITIGSDVWIGRDAVILGGVTIGDGAIVGAYSVVAKDVPPYAVVVGNPAQVIRYRFSAPSIAALLRIRWWDWPDETIAARADALRDVRLLLAEEA